MIKGTCKHWQKCTGIYVARFVCLKRGNCSMQKGLYNPVLSSLINSESREFGSISVELIATAWTFFGVPFDNRPPLFALQKLFRKAWSARYRISTRRTGISLSDTFEGHWALQTSPNWSHPRRLHVRSTFGSSGRQPTKSNESNELSKILDKRQKFASLERDLSCLTWLVPLPLTPTSGSPQRNWLLTPRTISFFFFPSRRDGRIPTDVDYR